jgi:hypothetical protein
MPGRACNWIPPTPMSLEYRLAGAPGNMLTFNENCQRGRVPDPTRGHMSKRPFNKICPGFLWGNGALSCVSPG